MKKRRVYPLWIGFILLLAVSAYLYFRTAAVGTDTQQRVMPALRELRQLNAEWDADILKSRNGINSNYDAVASALHQIRDVLERLRNGLLEVGSTELERELRDLDSVFAEKEDLVEQFKSHNALLHNSLRYFPTGTEDFTANLRNMPASDMAQKRALDELRNTMRILLTDILRFNLRPEKEAAEKIQAAVAAMEANRGSYPPAVQAELDLLLRHACVILQQRLEEDALLDRISNLPAAQRIDRLSDTFDRHFNEMLEERQRYRTYLFIYSGFLLLLLTYAAWRLMRTYRIIARVNQRLRTANETLELRVAERTAELERQSARLEEMATHDALTGLINRRYLMMQLNEALQRAERRGWVVALMFIDLDGFKAVNDRFGHAAGDAVLKEAAQRLKRHVRKEDAIARLGGDEFVILLNDANPFATQRIAEAALEELQSMTLVEGYPVRISASIGVSSMQITTGGDHFAETLLTQADRAMYEAKQQGKSCFRFSSTNAWALAC